eukprot:10985415-Ditylum_brightwellii.AAC.1
MEHDNQPGPEHTLADQGTHHDGPSFQEEDASEGHCEDIEDNNDDVKLDEFGLPTGHNRPTDTLF